MNDVLKASLPSIISAGLPTLMVLVGILLSRNDSNRLDGRISSLETKMDTLAASLRAEMAQMRDTFHGDIVMLLQRDGEKDTRIVRLEERNNPGR